MNFKNFLNVNYLVMRLLVISILVLLSTFVSAQSLSDIQNLKVDNLSNAQIEQLINRAQSEGISPDRIDVLARERGMNSVEASKLKSRISLESCF